MYFEKHIFFCLNVRQEGETCCNNFGARDLQIYAKDQIKKIKCLKNKNIRINKAGCLGRCDNGPVLVIYPEGIWYQYLDKEDIDEIIDSHLIRGLTVKRLLI